MSFYGVAPILFESVSAVTATPSVDLGTRRIDAGNEYVYCYNAGGSTIAVSEGVKFITGASGYSVANTQLTSVANPCVGVCKHAAIAAGSYGWIITKGFTTMLNHPDSTTVGDYILLANGAAGCFRRSQPLTDAVGVGTFHIVGFATAVSAACGGSFAGFIKTGM